MAAAAAVSPLEELLQNPECGVEALLDEEDVIQEFRACNDKLVTRLSQPDAAKVLMKFITEEPPEQASSARCFRYPFVSVELMTCGPENFLLALVQADEVMDSLWSFLENTKPSEVNLVLAGYFARSAAAVYTKHPAPLVNYLRQRGADALMQRFLERLHLRSLAELFARFLCVEQDSLKVFSDERLVAQLLDRLKDETSSHNDTQENVTLIVLELLSQKDSICFSEELFRQLTSCETVASLVDQIFGGRPGRVAPATAILSNIVFHVDVSPTGEQGGGSSANQTPTLSPLAPPPMPSGEDDIVNVGADDEIAAKAPPSPPRSPSPACAQAGESRSWLQGRNTSLMQEISTHFPRIRLLLDAALDQSSSIAMPIGTISAIGGTTLEVVNLITMLTRTGHSAVLEAVMREQLLPRCLELFFRHPWSSLLHDAVKSLVSEVMSSTDGVRPSLIAALLLDGGLGERLVEEYKAESAEKADVVRYRHVRIGYMGHLQLLCTEFRAYGSRVAEVGAALASVSGWAEEVLPVLEATKKTQSEELGGGVADWDRGLASSGSTAISVTSDSPSGEAADVPSSGGGLSDDFALDDL